MNKYIIVLSGQGDTNVKVVNQKTWDWINEEWFGRGIESSIEEEIPESKGETAYITIGSYDNDRAIFAKGKDFDTLTQAIKWVAKQGHNLVDTYEGCIY